MDEENSVQDRYILFYISSELYGTPIKGIREVIEYQAAKPVPNTVEYFEGVINVRGEVMGVVDLRKRLGTQPAPSQCQLVVETQSGSLAVVVDRVESVHTIPEREIEKHPAIQGSTDSAYLIGIGKMPGRLVTLIDLSQLLGSENLSVA